MARILIRASINGPSPNTKQQDLRKILERNGLRRIGTGAYEGSMSMAGAYAVLGLALEFFKGLPEGFELDHLWTYVDQTDAE
ncbi:hypothetical protein [Janibacter melonis]|uniref:hypothetical protein n=1 Tax=Janibacter melonis TaxID=262209 RepID=UPI002094D4EE|nr:hypothetical protein [Janibacter melonis]